MGVGSGSGVFDPPEPLPDPEPLEPESGVVAPELPVSPDELLPESPLPELPEPEPEPLLLELPEPELSGTVALEEDPFEEDPPLELLDPELLELLEDDPLPFPEELELPDELDPLDALDLPLEELELLAEEPDLEELELDPEAAEEALFLLAGLEGSCAMASCVESFETISPGFSPFSTRAIISLVASASLIT